MQKAISFNDVVVAFAEGNDYRFDFWYMSKDESINIMKNSELSKKVEHGKNIVSLLI